MKDLELWLDESGDFRSESQIDMKKFPSLVGGVLLEKGSIPRCELSEIVSQGRIDPLDAHGMCFDDDKKRSIIIPALQDAIHKGARLIYFENRERLTDFSHIELYLRLLASGITQLTQVLAAEYTEFSLSIIIAEKGVPEEDLTNQEWLNHDVHSGYSTALLSSDEISSALRQYIKEKWDEGQFDVESRSRVSFVIRDARDELCLKLADYAANARITRKSKAFSGEYRPKLNALFENAYIFSVFAKTLENEINMDLSAGDFGTALSRLYLERGILDHTSTLKRIMERFSAASFRLGKLQLSSFTDSIVTYARNNTDLEEVEQTLKRVLNEVFSEENRKNIPFQSELSEYKLRLCLIDMYLREGDLESAETELEKIHAVIMSMNYRIENLKYLYFYIDRKALYYINCMEYEKAVDVLTRSIRAIETIQNDLARNDELNSYFKGGEDRRDGKRNSEYLGNALCMKIYAEMFLQRLHPELYEEIVFDTEYALSQYEYPRELERNQQYRAHVEMEHGNYRSALQWLLKTREIELDSEEDIFPWCESYLEEAMDEDPLSRTYYLMYYVELMYEATRGGSRDFAARMDEALNSSKGLYQMFFTEAAVKQLNAGRQHTESSESTGIDLVTSATREKTQLYHPIEIVWWKWGAYQCLCEKNIKQGLRFMSYAAWICQHRINESRYLVMQVTGLGILLEQISIALRYSMNDDGQVDAKHTKEIRQIINELKRSAVQLSESKAPEKMKAYIEEVKSFAMQASASPLFDAHTAEEADRLSREIAY